MKKLIEEAIFDLTIIHKECEDITQGSVSVQLGNITDCINSLKKIVENDSLFTINTWPESQTCQGCKHGTWIEGKNLSSSTYLCKGATTPLSNSCNTLRSNNKNNK